MENSRKFTIEELVKFDGKEGRPAYVAYNGIVYDVTDSYLWIDGNHLGEHDAGKDLSEGMAVAPHSDEVMERMKVVGILA